VPPRLMRSLAACALVVLALHAAVEGADPRIAPVPEGEWTDAQRAIVARFGPGGRPTNALRVYLRHPVLAENILPFEQYISVESTLTPRHRALLILRTAWLCRSQYVWAQHAGKARAAGITSAELERVARGPDAAGWDPFDAVLLRAADELYVDSFVTDRTWAALTATYDTRQAMDAVFTVAEFTMIAGTVNSLGVPVDDNLPDRLPAGIPHAVAATRTNERLIGKPARIAALEPAEWSADVRQWLARYGSGTVAGIYRTYARHLAMDQPRTRVSEHIRQQSTLSTRIRELLIIRIGVLCRSEYEWAAHAPAGRRAGLTDADIQRIVEGPSASGVQVPGAGDNALLRAADELHRDAVVSDATWRELAAVFDSKQMLDVLITIGGYRMVSMALNTFGVQLEPGAERFPESLR
jgi:4-carboxymuconolactone decarboxylase